MTLWIDSTSAMQAMKSPEPTSRARHYVLMYMTVRGYSIARPENIRFVRTDLQRADGLTKHTGGKALVLLIGIHCDYKVKA